MPPFGTGLPRGSSQFVDRSLKQSLDARCSANRSCVRLGAAQDSDSIRRRRPSSLNAMPELTQVRLVAEPLTPEAFKPFGQVVGPSDDGAAFGVHDAKLNLTNGTPRFYIMRLPKRGLKFDRITFHAKVTQCLGGLGSLPWYIAVAAPSVAPKPETEDIKVFRVPPGLFIKLECGTWHGGPLFDSDQMDFYNLELSDTNVVDHNTHVYSKSDSLEYVIEDSSL
ncbi:hypothetical protein BSKO_11803 [Bryopsis sp. KO-2023]|nr:hypothetical protein BSKO_11803 [Bryopsis sp. KO-2023]